MKIGIVSDLHRHLPAFVEEAFAGVERILCAGDTEDERLLWQLQTIAAVTNVRGNNDWSISAPLSTSFEIEGVHFFMVHRPQDVGTVAPGVQVVVHGHTHIPRDEVIDGVRYINPGSPTYPRGGHVPSCMVAEIDGGQLLSVRLIEAP